MKAILPEPPPIGVGDEAGVLVATAVSVKTGVEVSADACVDVGAGGSGAEGLAGASGLHADETRISRIRVQVTIDCFLMASFSLCIG